MDLVSGLMAALFAASPAPAAPGEHAPPRRGVRVERYTLHEQIIIRVPAHRDHPPRSPWRERGHDGCVAMSTIAGAAVMRPDAVDFTLRGGRRVRAYFEDSCPALDYYSGFYVLPTADGRMCADRDAIHDRSGNACEITRFRTLIPRERRRGAALP